METLVAGKNKQIKTIATILGIIIFCQLPTCFHVSVTRALIGIELFWRERLVERC